MTTQRLDVVAPPARKEQTDVKFKQHSDEDMVQFNKRVRRATATAYGVLALKTGIKMSDLLDEGLEHLESVHGKT